MVQFECIFIQSFIERSSSENSHLRRIQGILSVIFFEHLSCSTSDWWKSYSFTHSWPCFKIIFSLRITLLWCNKIFQWSIQSSLMGISTSSWCHSFWMRQRFLLSAIFEGRKLCGCLIVVIIFRTNSDSSAIVVSIEKDSSMLIMLGGKGDLHF